MKQKGKRKKEKTSTIKIKKGLFFKSDFKKLPNDIIIYIDKGLLIYDKEKHK